MADLFSLGRSHKSGTDTDIAAMDEYLDIMNVFRCLGERLGGEDRSTVNLIFPLVKEMLAHLEENIAKGTQKTFCQALKNEVVKYFAYVIDPDSCDFDPFYVCSTYLDPFYMGVLDDKMMNVAKNGLKKLMVVEITRRRIQRINWQVILDKGRIG